MNRIPVNHEFHSPEMRKLLDIVIYYIETDWHNYHISNKTILLQCFIAELYSEVHLGFKKLRLFFMLLQYVKIKIALR